MQASSTTTAEQAKALPPAKALILHDGDDVAVMTTDGAAGQACDVRTHSGETLRVALTTAAPFGHKIAIRPLPKAHVVKKYGQPIGLALSAIDAGAHVHTHNLSGYRSNLRGENA